MLSDDVDSPRESASTIDKSRGATKHLDTLDIREIDREIEAQVPRLTTADIDPIEEDDDLLV